MENLIVALWDSSACPPSKPPTASSSHRQPNHSYLCPPHPANPWEDRERGDRAGKIKHTPGMYQHTNMASAQASTPLHCYSYKMFGARLWSPSPNTNHRISDISLRPPPHHHLHPPAVEPLGMFCENTAPQGSAGGPLQKAQQARIRGPLAPSGPRGPHQR